MAEEKECCCSHKTKERSEKEYKDMIHRLNRIEGQIRGIKGMVERDAYCTDILVQVAAVNAALNSFNKVLLTNHIKTCVTNDILTSLLHGAPNMDTLVALGAGASFGYSTYALFAMTGAQVRGDMDAVMGYMHEFYFESAAMILTLITVGKMLESHAKGRTTDALKALCGWHRRLRP